MADDDINTDGGCGGKSGKKTITLNLTEAEMVTLDELTALKDLTKPR